MLAPLEHGDVTQLQFSTWKSRASNMQVSAFVCDGVLIDAGIPDVVPELSAWVDAHPIDGAIVTHAHEDHSAAVAALTQRGIGVHCAPLSEALMRADERVGYYRQFCWGPRRTLTLPLKPFASTRFELRHAPGHSADHHVVWDHETGTVFCGDLFIGVKLRLAHHDEDVRQQIGVLREVASWNPTRMFDAHRGLLDKPVALLNAKADWIEATVAEVEKLAQEGLDEASIRTRVLGPEELTGVISFGAYSRLNFVRNTLTQPHSPARATT